MSPNESAKAICQRGDSIKLGPAVHGDSNTVDVPQSCPRGYRRIGVTHNHPSGSNQLSQQDKVAARHHHLEHICVRTKPGVKCYRFNRA